MYGSARTQGRARHDEVPNAKGNRYPLINLLNNNMDVFAWKPSDMVGVPRRLIKHALNVNNSVLPVAQKRRVLACPKDYYPLPEINLKIKAVMGHPFKRFLDAYKGYHRNAGATYQCLVDSDFQTQLGSNLEAHGDDMVIKSKIEQEMIMDIAKTFDKDQHEAKPNEVFIRRRGRKVLRLHGHLEMNMGEPQEDEGNSRHAVP
ncbi:hypothetical protein Tco_0077183 [Tanacetum coccineum]